jgi:argininosuccinate synthase
VKVIAPWREWELNSRSAMMDYAQKHQIPIERKSKIPPLPPPHAGGIEPAHASSLPLLAGGAGGGNTSSEEAPYSMDANLLHISYEGKALEDPWVAADESMFRLTVSPEQAPDTPEIIEVEFERGDAVAVNGRKLSPAALLTELNRLGGTHGIGRLDLVENRYVGMKSRGVYETPGGTILLAAHRGIESITLDRGAAHLKDEIMPRYAELIYFGYWFSPEREMLQALIDKSQEHVTGTVRLKLYKGSVSVIGRKSPHSLYSMQHVTFEADSVYNQQDAEGFIKLNALRLRLLGQRK